MSILPLEAHGVLTKIARKVAVAFSALAVDVLFVKVKVCAADRLFNKVASVRILPLVLFAASKTYSFVSLANVL